MHLHILTCIFLAPALISAENGIVGVFKNTARGITDWAYNTARSLSDGILGRESGTCTVPVLPTGAIFSHISCSGSCDTTSGSQVSKGTRLTYSCHSGYIMSGSAVSTCSDGVWSAAPNCIKTCSPLMSNTVDISCRRQGGMVPCHLDILPGTLAILACKYSYVIAPTEDLGYREILCLEGGIWTHPVFQCRPAPRTSLAPTNTAASRV